MMPPANLPVYMAPRRDAISASTSALRMCSPVSTEIASTYPSITSLAVLAVRTSLTKSVSLISFKNAIFIVFNASIRVKSESAPCGCKSSGTVTNNTTFVFLPSTAPRFTSLSSVLTATRHPRRLEISAARSSLVIPAP